MRQIGPVFVFQYPGGAAAYPGNVINIGQSKAVRIIPIPTLGATPPNVDPVYGATTYVLQGGFPSKWRIGNGGLYSLVGPVWIPSQNAESINFVSELVGDDTVSRFKAGAQYGIGFAYSVDVADEGDDLSDYGPVGPSLDVIGLAGEAAGQGNIALHAAYAQFLTAQGGMPSGSKLSATIQNRGAASIFVLPLPAAYGWPAGAITAITAAQVAAQGFEVVAGGSISLTIPRASVILGTAPSGDQTSPADTRVTSFAIA